MISTVKKKPVVAGAEATRDATGASASRRIEHDFQHLEGTTAKVELVDKDNLLSMFVTVTPQAGTWARGVFKFIVNIPFSYPYDAPKVLYIGTTRLWHPNIEGDSNKKEWGVCLNILKADWLPTLSMREVIFGLEFMFYEPNLDDPLPGTAKEAALQLRDDPKGFERKAKAWMQGNYV